ncbi:MAG: signal peptidase II [Myxococcales bacterium]|nr:signal peptidase II [Myxococcales bacterium]
MLRRKEFWLIALLPTLFGFDWGSKAWVNDQLPVGGEIEVIPGWLSVLHAENPDILFSIPMPLVVIAVAGTLLMGVLTYTWVKLPADATLHSAAIATIAAGGLGNLLDRIGDGSVTDFVCVTMGHPQLASGLRSLLGTETWPIFNVADVALLVGAGLWLFADTRTRTSSRPRSS